MSKSSLGLGLLAIILCAGCSFSQSRANTCSSDAECAPGSCYLGLCVSDAPTAAIGGKGGRSGGNTSTGNSETTGEEGGAGGPTGTTMSPATGQSGAGGSSQPAAQGGSSGSRDAGVDSGAMTPPATGDCKSTDAPRTCTIAAGCMGMQRCTNNKWGACEAPADRASKAETCNGLDDNCNGVIDEGLTQRCYPAGTAGCTQKSDGTFDCKGICQAGTQECMNGQLTECTGFTKPQATDSCDGVNALDEDCNGTVDDGCNCTANKSCYGGAGMAGVGECRAGTLMCVNGRLDTQCVGEVRDGPEVCNNKDDDCNGKVDDVPGVGGGCIVPLAKGVCASGSLACVASSAALQCVAKVMAGPEICNGLDDNCDGTVDNVPGLETNSAMCGACGGPVCGADSACCASSCVNVKKDAQHCGACGTVCPANQMCVDGLCKPPVVGGSGGASGSSGGAGGAGGSMPMAGASGGTAGAAGAP